MNQKILKIDNIPQKLYHVGERKFFKKNDIIVHSGDIADHIYILVKGSILLLTNAKSGASFYHYLLVPPNLIGETHIFSRKEMEPTLKCVDNVEVIKINRNTLLNITSSDLDIANYLQDIFLLKLNSMAKQTIDYATLSSEERITDVLLEFAEVLGEEINGKIKIKYKISQQFISNLTGVKRITTYRAFEKFKELNIIEYRDGYYYINNLDFLKNYASTLKK